MENAYTFLQRLIAKRDNYLAVLIFNKSYRQINVYVYASDVEQTFCLCHMCDPAPVCTSSYGVFYINFDFPIYFRKIALDYKIIGISRKRQQKLFLYDSYRLQAGRKRKQS